MRSGEARKKFPNNSVNNVITLATRVRIQLLKVTFIILDLILFLILFLDTYVVKMPFCISLFQWNEAVFVLSNGCHLGGLSFAFKVMRICFRAWQKNICEFIPVGAPSWRSFRVARRFWWGWRRPTDRRRCPLPRQFSRRPCHVLLPTLLSN